MTILVTLGTWVLPGLQCLFFFFLRLPFNKLLSPGIVSYLQKSPIQYDTKKVLSSYMQWLELNVFSIWMLDFSYHLLHIYLLHSIYWLYEIILFLRCSLSLTILMNHLHLVRQKSQQNLATDRSHRLNRPWQWFATWMQFQELRHLGTTLIWFKAWIHYQGITACGSLHSVLPFTPPWTRRRVPHWGPCCASAPPSLPPRLRWTMRL